MASLKGTQTERNLVKALAGETQAAARYSYFAKKAKKEGFEQIAAVLERTSVEEDAHASRFFKLLEGGNVEVTSTFVAGGNGKTSDNLRAAADGEREEVEVMYPEFARTAREEGFEGIAKVFEATAVAEKHHEWRHRGMLAHLEAGTVFKREKPVVWRCRKCGYLHEGTEAPEQCPACAHPQGYFEVLGESW